MLAEYTSVAGELSFILKIRLPDTAALLALIDRIRKIPGVDKIETTIVLKTQIDRPIPLKPLAVAKKET